MSLPWLYVSKIKVKYYEETQQHDIKIEFRFPLVDDGIDFRLLFSAMT